jgi:hypothetical protein
MHKLFEYICDELKQLENKVANGQNLSMQELQYGDTLAHFKKNLLSADAMMGEEEYSGARGGNSYYPMTDYRSYNSYPYNRGGRSYRGARRDGNGRYSGRDGGYSMGGEEMISDLRELMETAPDEQTRKEFQKFITKLEQM